MITKGILISREKKQSPSPFGLRIQLERPVGHIVSLTRPSALKCALRFLLLCQHQERCGPCFSVVPFNARVEFDLASPRSPSPILCIYGKLIFVLLFTLEFFFFAKLIIFEKIKEALKLWAHMKTFLHTGQEWVCRIRFGFLRETEMFVY